MGPLAPLRLAIVLAGAALAGACFLDDLLSPKAPPEITIELASDSLVPVGDTVRLTVRATLPGGTIYRGLRFTYGSDRPTVGTVDDSGRVTALLRDTFSITVTGRSGSLVGEPPSATIRLRGAAARVVASQDRDTMPPLSSIGASAQLSAVAQTKQGDAIPGVRFAWLSENPQLVSVDSTGRVVARGNTGPPRVRVIVSADGTADTVRVGVRQRTRTLVISPSRIALTGVNQTVQFSADARDSLGAVNVNPFSKTVWSTTAPQIVTTDTMGLARTTGEGIGGVVASSDGVADTARVVVSRVLQSLTVTPEAASFEAVGDQIQLAASGVDEQGDAVGTPVIEWRSLDPAVVTTDTAGLITAAGNGVGRVVGAAGGREDTVVVTVNQILASVAIVRPANDTTLTSLGDSARFVAQGHDRNGHRIPLDRCCAFAYSSDNPAVATVDPGLGLVVARNNGSATITAAAGGFAGSRVVNVSQQIWSVDVSPSRVSVLQNQRVGLSATAYDRRGSRIQFVGFAWSSRNAGVANPLGSTTDTVTIQAGNVNDSTYVLASTGGGSDSTLVRVGPLASLCPGGTPHTGSVTSSQTWTRATSPHCVGGNVLIQAATLTIEAGATVKFAAGATLDVGLCCNPGQSGRIRANGTSSLPITFTALDTDPRRGLWGGIRTHWVAANDSLIFRNVVMEYGGGAAGLSDAAIPDLRYGTIGHANTCQGTIVLDAVTIRNSRFYGVTAACGLTINNSMITGAYAAGVLAAGGLTRVTGTRISNSGWGLDIRDAATLVDLSGTRITGNFGTAVRVTVPSLDALQGLPADSLLGNVRDVIEVTGSGNLTTRDLFVDRRVPWQLEGASIGIGGNRTLTIDAGTTIRGSGSTIYVGASGIDGSITIGAGRIVADGAAGEIRFTSGRSNPQPGDWGFIWIKQLSDTSVFRNVVLEYGGPCCTGGHILAQHTTGALVLDRVTSRRSQLQGIHVSGPLVVRGPIYADSNASDGFELQAPGVTIADSRFVGNGGYGLRAKPSAKHLTIRRSQFVRNVHGLALHADSALVEETLFRRNDGNGISVSGDGSTCCPTGARVLRSTIDSNGVNGIATPGSTNAVLEDNLVADNGGTGVVHHNGGRLARNRVRGNRYPVAFNPSGLGALATQDQDSLLGNVSDTLIIEPNACCDVVAATDTLRTTAALPWRFQSGPMVRFRNGTVWKLEAGALVVVNGTSIQIDDATVRAEGTALSPVRFTSDTKSRGAWGWFDFQARRDTSRLRHVEFRYGGSGSDFSLRVAGAPSKPVVLDNVRVTQGGGDGIRIDDEAFITNVVADSNTGRGLTLQRRDITISDSRFEANGGDGVWGSNGAKKLTLRRSTLYRNGGGGASLNGDSTTVDSSLVRRNGGSGITFCCDNNNPLRPTLLRSVVDSNAQVGVSMAGAVGGRIQDNQIIANGGVGLTHHNGGVVSGNRVRGNRLPITVNASSIPAITSQNVDSLLGNTGDTLVVSECCGEEVTAADTIRTRPQLPWRIDVGLRFVNRTVWKLEPGSQVFLNGGRIQIGQNPPCNPSTQGAVLRAESDDAAPIRFTSRNQARGAWSQILLECLSDSTKLRNVEVRYAGSGGQDAIRIAPGTAGVPVILDSVRVRQSGSRGILIQNGAKVVVQRYLAADSNSSDGLYVEPSGLSVPRGSFRANGQGIQVWASGFTLSNAVVRDNASHGLGINGQGAAISNSVFARNGGAGIRVDGDAGTGHTITGIRADSNSSHGVQLLAGPVAFTNNTARGNGSDGVSTSGTAQFFTAFSGNTITQNSYYGVVLDGASLGPFAAQDQSALLGNGRDTLCVCSGPNDARMTSGSPTVRAILPWKNQVSLTVSGDRTLNLEPGARMVMDNGAALFVGRGDGSARGRLLALGTAADLIKIVARDTTVRGFWHQLAIANQHDSSVLRHVELVGGGGTGSSQVLYVGDLNGLVVRLDSVTVRKSDNHGVWFGGGPFRISGVRAIDNDSAGAILTGGALTINGSRFETNGFAGIRVDGGGTHVITGSILRNNGTWGLQNTSATQVNAENNWWGSNAAPGAGGNNPVNGLVDFDPWLISEPLIAGTGLRARQLAQVIESRGGTRSRRQGGADPP